MAKKSHLNSIANRFQLQRPRKVGDMQAEISRAMPMQLSEWENYYYSNVKPQVEIESLGKTLFEKIHSKVIPELEAITEEECIDYLKHLVIDDTFKGYRTRFEILEKELYTKTGIRFNFMPDHPEDWRFKTYKIEYYNYNKELDVLLGIKVCPYSMKVSQDPNIIRTLDEIKHVHKIEEDRNAGHFFILFYKGNNKEYKIMNPEIFNEIKEIKGK